MPLDKLPKIKHSEVIAHGYFDIRSDVLQLDNEEEYTYYTLVSSPAAVMVIAKTAEGLYVINKEYRHPSKQILLSCPGGVQNHNETAIECAQREFLEETGYQADTWKVIGEAFPFPGISFQKTIYVKASNAYLHASPSLEPAEFIETILLSEAELKKQIKEGVPVDGILLTALFFNCLQD